MATIRSAGLLLYRITPVLEVWLAHMGGPFWARKDDGAWSIPKGIYEEPEHALEAALREFHEEIGVPAPEAEYAPLGEFRQSSGKVVTAYTAEADLTVAAVVSNAFELEWPPRSGRIQEFPEIDDARWFPLEVAQSKVVKGQLPILAALDAKLRNDGRSFLSQ